jgi:hypothetical protein
LNLIIKELERMGGGYKNIYSSENYQDIGGGGGGLCSAMTNERRGAISVTFGISEME